MNEPKVNLVAGIDVSAERGLDAAILDSDGTIVEVTWIPHEALGTWLSVWQTRLVVVAVDAPGQPAHASGGRNVEKLLAGMGIAAFFTPTSRESAPKWMQFGWAVYSTLRAAGFAESRVPWSGTPVSIECYPYAAYVALCGKLRRKQEAAEDTKDKWSRDVLRQQLGLKFEPTRKDAADAVAAAATALAHARGDSVRYGTEAEGVIWTPRALPEGLTRGRHTTAVTASRGRTTALPGGGATGCPIPGCVHEYRVGRNGWDGHVGSLRAHPKWHPDVMDPEQRRHAFRQEFPEFFR